MIVVTVYLSILIAGIVLGGIGILIKHLIKIANSDHRLPVEGSRQIAVKF